MESLRKLEKELGDENYFLDNYILHKFDTTTAFWFSAVLKKFLYLENKNRLNTDNSFSITQNEIKKLTNMMSFYKQKKAINNLIGIGLVKVDRRGLPAQNYYTIDFDLYNKLEE
jgi:hypothetical protein